MQILYLIVSVFPFSFRVYFLKFARIICIRFPIFISRLFF
jgi:hypothetical protein